MFPVKSAVKVGVHIATQYVSIPCGAHINTLVAPLVRRYTIRNSYIWSPPAWSWSVVFIHFTINATSCDLEGSRTLLHWCAITVQPSYCYRYPVHGDAWWSGPIIFSTGGSTPRHKICVFLSVNRDNKKRRPAPKVDTSVLFSSYCLYLQISAWHLSRSSISMDRITLRLCGVGNLHVGDWVRFPFPVFIVFILKMNCKSGKKMSSTLFRSGPEICQTGNLVPYISAKCFCFVWIIKTPVCIHKQKKKQISNQFEVHARDGWPIGLLQ